MALQKTKKSKNIENGEELNGFSFNHLLEVSNMKKDIAQIQENEHKTSALLDRFSSGIEQFNLSVVEINNTIEHFTTLPDKVRKLEDKSILQDLVEKIIWMIVGAFVAVVVADNYKEIKKLERGIAIEKQLYIIPKDEKINTNKDSIIKR